MTDIDFTALANRIVREVAELGDRHTPEDWPEAMLVTADELKAIVVDHLASASEAAGRQAAPQPEGGLSAAIKHGEMQIGIDGELEVAERRIAELEATLREAETILDDMIPYAQATIGLPRPSWSYDNVILRAERWKIDLTTAGAGKGEE